MSKYPGGVPPGLSSEEDSDDDFELSSSTFKKNSVKTNNYFIRPDISPLSPVDQLFESVKNGNLSVIKELINDQVDLNSIQGGWSPLMYACFYGFPDVISILLENGANINIHREFFTPLMSVCSNSGGSADDRLKCVEILLKYKVDVNAADRFRTTPLMFASREGHVGIVKILIERGADLNKIDREGWSAIFHAVNYNKSEIVDILVQTGANLEMKDIRGRSLHDLATIKGFNCLAKKVEIKKDIQVSDEQVINIVPVKTVQQMLNELPSRNSGINPGFPTDVYNLLQAMNMDVYVPCFYKSNIQLGEFLVITNEKLKELGVKFSAHRQKILISLKYFHLYRWQKNSIGLKFRHEKFELMDGLKLVVNSTRQLHVIQTSLFYLQLNKLKSQSKDEFKKTVRNALNQTKLLQKELTTLQSMARMIDLTQKVKAVDIIKYEELSEGKIESIVKVGVVCFIGGMLIWRNRESCFSVFERNLSKIKNCLLGSSRICNI